VFGINNLKIISHSFICVMKGKLIEDQTKYVSRFLATLTINGKLNKIFQYFPVRGHSFLSYDRNFGLIKKVLHKINRVYTAEEYRKFIEQSSNKGKFSVAMCNDNFSTEHKRWWSKFYKNNAISVHTVRR
jgi:hypothetical protein